MFEPEGLGKTTGRRDPIFSIADELVLLNFYPIFSKGREDSALLNAALLTFSFAATGAIDMDSLGYQNRAIASIRSRMTCPDEASSESTLAAIILLAGIEARLSLPIQVELHMNAVQQLLHICEEKGICLTDGIKRAIFWQDLNSSVMTGSKRIVNHKTFTELRWRRDPFASSDFILPPGFHNVQHLLTDEFIEVLEDIHALQRVREASNFAAKGLVCMVQIDNHQASIQSRLVNLEKASPFLECCNLAAYLCSTMLRCKIWTASVVPSQLSLQLLGKLQQACEDSAWDLHPDALLWLLYMGGSFSSTGSVRSQYVALVRLNQSSRFKDRYNSWEELHRVLVQFVWSEKAFLSNVHRFWEEVAM